MAEGGWNAIRGIGEIVVNYRRLSEDKRLGPRPRGRLSALRRRGAGLADPAMDGA